MIIHQREMGYGRNYTAFFETLARLKAYLENKHPEVSVQLMYSLAGQRGRATILTKYPSLADYERIDADMDGDEEYAKLFEGVTSEDMHPVVDQFHRVIQG